MSHDERCPSPITSGAASQDMELAAISQRVDEVALPIRAHDDGCEAALGDRRGDKSHLRTRVENAISPLLPHGRVLVEDVARSLGMSERTLARKLSDETLNFTEILQQLRRDLAVRYLDDRKLHVSKIAWLLGFRQVSAFTHAYNRWTGKTPRQMRTAGESSKETSIPA
jgi:AraC-like DNA-binding protein